MKTLICYLLATLLSTQLVSCTAPSLCPDECRCTGTTVVCSDLGLRYVPRKIPPGTEKLDLSKNNISHITLTNFAGLTKLRKLNLGYNRISSIHYRAFEDMTSLNILYLDHNEISCIQDKTFRPLKEIEILTLNNNNITTLSTHAFRNRMTNLRIFRMHTNPIRCDCHLTWFASWLRRRPNMAVFTQCSEPMNMRGRNVNAADKHDFVCNDISEHRRPICEAFSCPSLCSCENGWVDCRDRNMQVLPQSFPRDATEIRLEQNSMEIIPSYAFSPYKQLTRIDLSNNKIREIEKNAFEGLTQLTALVLYGNELTSLPQGIFNGLPNLEML